MIINIGRLLVQHRRGFSAAASGGVARSGGGSSPVTPKKGVNEKVGSAHKVSWVPDPKTGYYRPDNVAAEMDVAEQREALLKQKN